uniref:Photosystem I assembly protein Ycf4 n=1 Tax=Haptophyceae sp. NIES-3900 TaxID=2748608 RepID=A0A7R6WDU6_9EUKA|nr:photosystem I assembly protein ycf4 [Haptophyceae sp. NIES-3900]
MLEANINQANQTESSSIRFDQITGSRRPSNFFWAIATGIGGLGFLLAGLSSYFEKNLLPFAKPIEIIFIPQGMAMSFYGTLAIFLGTFLWLTIFWNVGFGYNIFNKITGRVYIIRLGFPGKNRWLCATYLFEDIQAVQVEIKSGLDPKRELLLVTKDQRIPLLPVGEPLPLSEVEDKAIEIAKILAVPVEGV